MPNPPSDVGFVVDDSLKTSVKADTKSAAFSLYIVRHSCLWLPLIERNRVESGRKP